MRSVLIGSRVLGTVAVAFGVMTIFVGGSVALDVGTARADHGQYVPFVLWFNFLSGFAYVAAGIGLALRRRWAALVAVGIAVGIALTSLALGLHVAGGGAFETETAVAMGVRLLLWTGISVFALRTRPAGTTQPTQGSTT